MMRRLLQAVLLALVFTTLVACNSTPANSAVDVPNLNIPTTPVAADKTSIVGRVVSSATNAPLKDTTVRLAEVIRQGNQVSIALDGANSPGAVTREDGTFEISNIAVKEYAIVVGDIFGKYVIISEDKGKAKLWGTKAGEPLKVGELRVNL